MFATVRYGSGSKFGRLPCVKGTGEVLAGAEQSELL